MKQVYPGLGRLLRSPIKSPSAHVRKPPSLGSFRLLDSKKGLSLQQPHCKIAPAKESREKPISSEPSYLLPTDSDRRAVGRWRRGLTCAVVTYTLPHRANCHCFSASHDGQSRGHARISSSRHIMLLVVVAISHSHLEVRPGCLSPMGGYFGKQP
jgi:hypothetical protein